MENNRGLHLNYSIITDIVDDKSKVLDLGCGDGTLLKMLQDKKNVYGKGIEINQDSVISSIEKGVCTIQGDIDEGLVQFTDKEYDYVVLNRTVQATEHPDFVITSTRILSSFMPWPPFQECRFHRRWHPSHSSSILKCGLR